MKVLLVVLQLYLALKVSLPPLAISSSVQSPAGIVISATNSTIAGAIDFHVHSSPDIVSRSLDDFELAQMAHLAGMKAVVLKNHVTSTADRAVLASKIVPGIEIFGGIVLNRTVGGINPEAVEAMHLVGAGRGKVVWLPTIDADYHLKVFHKSGTGLKVTQAGKVSPETEAVLKIIAKENLVLETGHISPEEVIVVIQQARELGVKNIVVTHAMADVPGLSLADMRECAAKGAFLELAYVNDLMGTDAVDQAHRNWHQVSIRQMAEVIWAIGAEHFILSTDLGRKLDPLPVEGYKSFVEKLISEGISQQEINRMMKDNPAQLLGLSS